MRFIKTYLRAIALVLLLTFSVQAADVVTFYHTDPVGTPLAMSDQKGEQVWQAEYKPFGEEFTVNDLVDNNRRFVGKEKDDETGLDYFGARYLSVEAGRFLAVDPVRAVDEFSGQINSVILANPQRLNVYAYSLNNPYRYVDPDGEYAGTIIKLTIQYGIPLIAGALASKASKDTAEAYRNLQEDNSNQANGNGKRRKNRIPDRGTPGTIKANGPGTTKKQYGGDGWVEKEWNQGHGASAPSSEQEDHIHDHIPNPHHPAGRPVRQGGRAPSSEEKETFK